MAKGGRAFGISKRQRYDKELAAFHRQISRSDRGSSTGGLLHEKEDKMKYKILRNKRTEPNDFKMEHSCDFCCRFASQVLTIHPKFTTFKELTNNICRTCLQEMCDALDKNMVDNFQKDFEESRRKQNDYTNV
jgi:hypothetical protein